MRTSYLSLVALLALSGCLLGPNYERPAVDAPPAFRFAESDAKALVNTAWWEQFQDPALNALIATALADNKDVKIAAARVEQFLGQFVTTRSQLFPQVAAGFDAQRQRVPLGSTQLPPGVGPVFNQFQATLSASWEIDFFGKLRRQTEAARANLLASEEGRRATILTLVASVASSYVNLLSLDRQLDIAKSTVASRAASVHVFQLRFSGGEVSQMELAQSQSEYQASLATIPQIELQIAQQEDALSILLGHNPGVIARDRELDDLALPAVPAGLPSELLERRPDLRQAEQDLIAANALIGAARALYFPSISLTGLFGSASGQFSSLFTGPTRVWSYAGAVTLPIFTAGSIGGQVKQAEAQQQQALFQYQKAIQVAFQEVADALVSLQKTREQLVVQGSQVDALRNYARLARLRYEGGYTSYIEVLDAERSLFNAQLSYAQTQGVVFTSAVSLYKAMGGGWVADAEHMTSTTYDGTTAMANPAAAATQTKGPAP
ncbi:efflux transporter outer membrane subunit [Caballeronia sp. SEWSISQ10-4 2]|uniref:efflux transporter outer membrane subunit n=1 Tax=Caballeronia sp. SEWSISQ10-4 2 TaxID=2937438 RepID=UPI0026550ED8|nr:efflux transporter outer membrane subunit [Caballeronia sp. SEWSISQ10-4 2]MDN7180235.1 efflux transporter outer membrane subunit [Caballeronia sp. SEWSISQ10-4 2]